MKNSNIIDRIMRNVAVILTGSTASSVLGFLSFSIMASNLGPEKLAYFALAQVYMLIANDLFNIQTWESMIKFGAKKDGSINLSSVIKTNFVLDLVSALLSCAMALLFAKTIASWLDWDETLTNSALIYSCAIPFILTTFTIGIPRLYNKFAVIAKIQFAIAFIKILLVVYLSYSQAQVLEYIGVYMACEILVNLCLILFSINLIKKDKTISILKAKLHLEPDQIKFLWWTNLRTIVRIPVRQLDMLIINQVMDLQTVGVYKVYKEIVSIISRLGEPVNQAVFPEYSKLLGEHRSSDTVEITRRIMLILLGVSGLVFLVFAFASTPIIETFFGKEYLFLMDVFYMLVVLNSINLFLTPINSLFIAAGFAKYSFFIVLLNNVLYLCIALVGGTYWGIYGIILAFSVQLFFNQGAKLFFLRRHSTDWGSAIR